MAETVTQIHEARFVTPPPEETDMKLSRRIRILRQLASICRKVPRHSPETFHGAIQSVWFAQVACWAEGTSSSFGRFDQYMLPFYLADIDAERITRDEALELIECLWLKCYSTFDFRHLTVGGVKQMQC